MTCVDAVRARLRLLFARRTAESRMDEEFRLHIDLETERLMREEGLAPDEARRRALAAFGGVERHKEALRDGRGLAWLGGFSLDLKLGVRMLVKYPALTLVGGAAMAFGIAAGVGAFEIWTQFANPSLPLDEGSRIVGLRYWNVLQNRPVLPTAHDVATWGDQLERIDDVSAFSASSRNLITSDGRSEAETLVMMSASAFRVVRVPPLLGRTLVEADEDPGAPAVVVVGHDIWQRRFSGDPEVVGRTVRLGRERTIVVGVMPAGFAFPVAHGLWVPLRRISVGSIPCEEPGLLVFGRLARGASSQQAQAELSAVSLRTAVGSPDTRERLRPQVVPYAHLFFDPGDDELRRGLALGNAFVVMLLLLVSANVALLMFARAATREREIAVRSALGAGRARIVTQLFVEALVLAGLAVAVGLAAVRVGLRTFYAMYEADSGQPLPFWMGDSLTPTTVIYAGALTILAASIIGVLPGLNVTGRGLQGRLQQSTAGGGGFRFGGVWTAVIASQVAATLMFPAAAFFFHRWAVAGQARDVGFSSARYLSGRLELDREIAPGAPLDESEDAFRLRVGRTYAELERRLIAEPEIAGLTFADRLPGTLHPRWRIEIDGEANPNDVSSGRSVSYASVAPNFFDALGAPILAGRAFTAADVDSASGVAIVNQSFVNQVLGGRNPVGRRIRRSPFEGEAKPGPWLEVVGLVGNLGMVGSGGVREGAGVYRPVSPDAASVLRIAIGVRRNPEMFAARLRAVGSEVEPGLRIHDLMPLDEAGADLWLESQYLSRLLAVLSALALLLSLSAVYSVMAFTVTQRTREIGIRVALGADRRQVIGVILRRPLAQVSFGVVIGGALVAAVFVGLFETTPTATEAALIAGYSMLMMVVCLLACIVPTRRALRVEPSRVLAAEG